MAVILNLTTSVIEVIRRTLDATHNAANQDLHLVAHLFGPVRKSKNCVVGADYSIVSEQLRTQLRTPMFSEHNRILRTACGKVVEAIGRCIL
ncbi:UNVERIFIED_CONTAM: hypothetical protein NCL1_48757 [Trichonephila clavipes]